MQVLSTPASRRATKPAGRLLTCVGVKPPALVLPSCPWLFRPQHHTAPVFSAAQAWLAPTARFVMVRPESVATNRGDDSHGTPAHVIRFAAGSTPTWPKSFRPQQ